MVKYMCLGVYLDDFVFVLSYLPRLPLLGGVKKSYYIIIITVIIITVRNYIDHAKKHIINCRPITKFRRRKLVNK